MDTRIRKGIVFVLLAALLAAALPALAWGQDPLNPTGSAFTGEKLFGSSQTQQSNTQGTKVPQLIWSDATGQFIQTVWINGEVATKGSTIKNGDFVRLTMNLPDGITPDRCDYKYKYIEYSSAHPEGFLTESPQSLKDSNGNYSFSIYADPLSDVEITITIPTQYPIWIKGKQVTSSNMNNILEKGFSISYVPERNTLFLNNAAIDGEIKIETDSPFNIVFSGKNTINGSPGSGVGISCKSDLSISSYSAVDTLTVTAPPANDSVAIGAGGNLRIGSDANVTAYSQGGTASSTGVLAGGLVEVSGKLSAAGGSAAESCGIRCRGLSVKNVNSAAGGEAAAYGGDCYSGGTSIGVLAEGNVTVEYQAKLAAAGRGAASNSCGVRAGGSFTNNGNADCSSGSAGNNSIGLFSDGAVTNAGTLSAKGGTSSGGASRGISAGSLMMTGGALDAHAVSGASGSVGIFAKTTISGGEVIAEGAGGAFSDMPAFSGYNPLIRVSDLNSNAFEADSSNASNYRRKYVYITSKVLSAAPTDITIFVGETRTLSAEVPAGYTLRWYGSNNMIAWVDEMLGTVTGRAPGTLMVTVKVYNPYNAQMSEASCKITVKEKETVPVTAIQLDQDNVTLTAIPGLRTVKYWFYPTNATDKQVTLECTDFTRSIVRVELSPDDQSFQITPVANGSAMITLRTTSGAKAYCKVTVNGIGTNSAGQKISYAIRSMDNDGVWYYDWSDSFTVKTTAPAMEMPGVEIDGLMIPQVTGARRNWTSGAADGGTAFVFTRQFMASLSRGRHTIAFSYPAVGKISRPFWVQSRMDYPKTGDAPLLPELAAFLLSGTAAAGTIVLQRSRKKQSDPATN